jgi:hypothetical protein
VEDESGKELGFDDLGNLTIESGTCVVPVSLEVRSAAEYQLLIRDPTDPNILISGPTYTEQELEAMQFHLDLDLASFRP